MEEAIALEGEEITCLFTVPTRTPNSSTALQPSVTALWPSFPPSDRSRPYQDDQLFPKEPAPPTTVNNASDTLSWSSIHNGCSISHVTQLHDVYSYLAPIPSLPFDTHPFKTAMFVLAAYFPSIHTHTKQAIEDTTITIFHSRTQGLCVVVNAQHTLPSKANHPSLNTRDEQDVPIVDDKQCLTTLTYANNRAPALTTSTSSLLIPWGQVPPPSIYENHLGEVFTPQIGNSTAQCLLNLTSTNVSDAREPQR